MLVPGISYTLVGTIRCKSIEGRKNQKSNRY